MGILGPLEAKVMNCAVRSRSGPNMDRPRSPGRIKARGRFSAPDSLRTMMQNEPWLSPTILRPEAKGRLALSHDDR
jgi:hypothetical protein